MGDVKEFDPRKPRNKKQKPPGDEQAKKEDLAGALADSGDAARQSQRDKLIALALNKQKANDLKLFRGPDDTAYAAFKHGGHREVWPLRSRGFKRWLSREYHRKYSTDDFKTGASSQAIAEALDTLEAVAAEGEEQAVHQRIARDSDGSIWIDLCDDQWQTVHVTSEGWREEKNPSIFFTRRRGMLPLPKPKSNGDWAVLWEIANIRTLEQKIMAVAWMLGAFRPSGPYAILTAEGEQGSGKSALCRILRGLVDPNEAPLRRPPREERDLFVAANNGHVLAFENLSGIPPWLSDALCTLSTGGGYAGRTLYENLEEMIINGQRPILLNGIDAIATRSDLRDRTLLLTLNCIPEDHRISEEELWEKYEAAKPQLLGLLLDAVSAALINWPTTKLDRSPRMADFARWIVAAEKGGELPWKPGDFLRTYRDAQAAMTAAAVESDRTAQAILAMMKELGHEWTGNATKLAEDLAPHVKDPDLKRDSWLYNPRALSNRLKRIAPDLRTNGLDVVEARTNKARLITITKLPRLDYKGNLASPSSLASLDADKPCNGADYDGDEEVTQAVTQATNDDFASLVASLEKPCNRAVCDEGDASDATMPTKSNGTPDDDAEVF